jgi:hypothetical protein
MAGVMDELRLDFGSRDVLFVSFSSRDFYQLKRCNLVLPRVQAERPSAALKERPRNYVNFDESRITDVRPRLSGQGMLKGPVHQPVSRIT